MIKACIFDMDGTLANTIDTIAYYGNTALKENGLKEIETENYDFYKLFSSTANGSTALYAGFVGDFTADEAQELVAKLQVHITANYYTCTDEILAGLGKMYVADERFKKNIDKYGDGTVEFAAEAIVVFCQNK